MSCIIFLSPLVTAGWRVSEANLKGRELIRDPKPRASEAQAGAKRKMIKEAATWTAPRGVHAAAADENMKGLRPLHASPRK